MSNCLIKRGESLAIFYFLRYLFLTRGVVGGGLGIGCESINTRPIVYHPGGSSPPPMDAMKVQKKDDCNRLFFFENANHQGSFV
jgi:hypothetical protein